MRRHLVSLSLVLVFNSQAFAQYECLSAMQYPVSDSFFHAASSAQGAVGDVVGIDVSLTITDPAYRPDALLEGPSGFLLTACYDNEALEFVAISYSEYYGRLAFDSFFVPYQERGFVLLHGFAGSERMESLLSSGVGFPLATLYFRIKAYGAGETEIRFCDFIVVRQGLSCAFNGLSYLRPHASTCALSSRHRSGLVRVLPGEPTHPDPPPVPPAAKVYPECPDPASLQIHFELDAPATTHPGARNVPVDVYATSNYEFSGFMAAIRFSPSELQLTRVEEHTRPGLVEVDNEKGGCGIVSVDSWTRVGAEGERVRLATLYFDVANELNTISEIRVELAPFGNFYSWVAIRYQSGTYAGAVPVTTEAAAIAVSDAVLALQVRPTRPGDANLDYEVNVTDAIDILRTLFQGADAVVCRGASDANGDGRMNLSDAIWILDGLFRGGNLREDVPVYCD